MESKLLLVIWVHWVADFILQSRQMASNKSSSNKWLTIHVSIYTLILMVFGWQFALVNGLIHWAVDWFSSRASGYFWLKKDVHKFFVVIGLDQVLHMTTLILTLGLVDESFISRFF